MSCCTKFSDSTLPLQSKIILAITKSTHLVPTMCCFAIASNATQLLCWKFQYCYCRIWTEMVVEKAYVEILVIYVLCNVTYMVRNVAMLLLLHSQSADKGVNSTTTKHQIFPYWLTLIETHISWIVKWIKRRVSLCSCDSMEDTLKRWVFVCACSNEFHCWCRLYLKKYTVSKTAYIHAFDIPLPSQFAVIYIICMMTY